MTAFRLNVSKYMALIYPDIVDILIYQSDY